LMDNNQWLSWNIVLEVKCFLFHSLRVIQFFKWLSLSLISYRIFRKFGTFITQ
jgi:hypothetical protein